MEQLRSSEGPLFQHESAKKLLLDVKALAMESFGGMWAAFRGDPASYQSALSTYALWTAEVQSEELQRAVTLFPDMAIRLQQVAVIYAKLLWSRPSIAKMHIARPRVEDLLRGVFRRMAGSPWVQSGDFFALDPIKQDFVVRDALRQALSSDCIKVFNLTPKAEATAAVVLSSTAPHNITTAPATALASNREPPRRRVLPALSLSDDAASAAFETSEEDIMNATEDNVMPDDSISAVMERSAVVRRPVVTAGGTSSGAQPALVEQQEHDDEDDGNAEAEAERVALEEAVQAATAAPPESSAHENALEEPADVEAHQESAAAESQELGGLAAQEPTADAAQETDEASVASVEPHEEADVAPASTSLGGSKPLTMKQLLEMRSAVGPPARAPSEKTAPRAASVTAAPSRLASGSVVSALAARSTAASSAAGTAQQRKPKPLPTRHVTLSVDPSGGVTSAAPPSSVAS